MNTVKQWENFFYSRGLSESYILTYIQYVEPLLKKGLPIIFEYEHLSFLLGIQQNKLLSMVNAPEGFYRAFKIPKRSGGQREILSPLPSLLSCQKWVYNNILLKESIHPAAHGFVRGRSIFTNAQLHLNKSALLKMDLKNFFPSISINWVINLFSNWGYADNVAFYLASLCCCNGHLVQGAATSPYLSNILLKGLDFRLSKLSLTYNIIYSRYADDLTFSGKYIPHSFANIVEEIVSSYGLNINVDKTRLHLQKGQRIVTGLSVSGERLTVPRAFKRDLKQELHYISKHGYLSHISKLKISNPRYLDQLIGRLSFWIQAEPDNEYLKSKIVEIRNLKRNF